MADDLVLIKTDRLKELEELEARLPRLIEDAVNEYKSNSLKRLHEKDKMNPKGVAERVKRYVEKNRDLLNERRRQNRKNKAIMLPNNAEALPPVVDSEKDTEISQRPRIYIINKPTLLKFE